MATDRLRAVDWPTANAAADIVDAAADVLRSIDLRHYYGDRKLPTKGALLDRVRRLRDEAEAIRELVNSAALRDDTVVGRQTSLAVKVRSAPAFTNYQDEVGYDPAVD